MVSEPTPSPVALRSPNFAVAVPEGVEELALTEPVLPVGGGGGGGTPLPVDDVVPADVRPCGDGGGEVAELVTVSVPLEVPLELKKSALPPYAATMDCVAPTGALVDEQLPDPDSTDVSVTVHTCVPPTLTVTVPVGAVPAGVGDTVTS